MYNPVLKVFVEVTENGSFGKASEKLFISPTAIYKQINLFEEHLGFKVFIRTPRGVQLTEAGKSIYTDAKKMMQYSEEAIKRANKIRDEERSVIRVRSSALYPCNGLVDLWNRVKSSYPQFKLKVIPFADSRMDVARRDIGKSFDLIVGAHEKSKHEWCNFLELGQSHFSLAMSREHKLAKKQVIVLQDLWGEHLMMMPVGNSPINSKIRQKIEIDHPQIILEDAPSRYDMEVFNACEEKECVLLTLESWSDIHPSLITIPFDIPYTMPYGIMYSLKPNEDTRRFLDIVSSIMQE